MEKKKREKWMDGVKTIAIFIVLLNHAQVQIPGVNFWGGMFYVPVFFVLAGYTYRQKEESFLMFVRQKAKRLLTPYFVANIFLLLFFAGKEYFIDKSFTVVRPQSILGIIYARNQLFRTNCEDVLLMEMTKHINGGKNVFFMQLMNAPTWFLPALFLSLILFDLLMRLCKQDQKRIGFVTALCLFVAVVYHYLCPILLPWSIDVIPYFLFLVQIGFVLKKHHVFAHILGDEPKKTKICRVIAACLLPIFIGSALINGSSNLSVAVYGNYIFLSLLDAISASFYVMLFCYLLEFGLKKDRIPAWLVAPGKHTMAILCYHLFVFMFLETAVTIFCALLGFSSNIYVVTILKLIMITVTITLFTLLGNRTIRRMKQEIS